jgi:putative colanic acid biosysnthesis UDP-glucose lipid carrier transferase
MRLALGHDMPSRFQLMKQAGGKHPGRTSFVIGLVNRGLPPIFAVLVLAICAFVYGVNLSLPYQLLMLVTVLLAVLLYGGSGAWEPFARRNAWATTASVTITWVLLFGILLLVGYATKTSDLFSRRVLLTWFVVTPPAIVFGKLLAYGLFLPLAKSSERGRRVLIAGANELGKTLATRISGDRSMGMQLVGFFDDRSADRLGDLPDGRLLGGLTELPDYVRNHQVDVIFIALPIRNVQRVSELIDELFDTTVSIYFLPDIFVFDLIQSRATDIGGLPAIALCETPFYGPSGVVKRVSDILMSGALLVLLSPLLLIVALAIKLTSPGSVIFRQRRYGLDGEEITVYKFRSMRVSEDGATVTQASRDDPRITPIGKILRRYSLDELPQLFNVLQGRMSLVGPRPHAVAHNEEYRGLIKGYMLRHKVRPGITGLAQVSGYRGETKDLEDMRKRIEFDLDYLRHWSLGLDLSIIFRTAMVVFKDEKAY